MRWLCVMVACAAASAAAAGRHRRRPVGGCIDYAGRPGTCGPIRQCPELKQLITGRIPTREEIQNLRNSLCGANFNICCASGVNYVHPDEHPNRRILDGDFNCGQTLPRTVVGGDNEVRLGTFPWMVLLGYTSDTDPTISYRCGGALISDRYVLTAAHCVTDLDRFSVQEVRLGEHNIAQDQDCQEQFDGHIICNDPQDFGIEEVIFHDDYNKLNPRMNDIALIRLNHTVDQNESIHKICLPFGEQRQRDFSKEQRLIVAGFGRTGPNQADPSSDFLQTLTVPGFDQDECGSIIRRLRGKLGDTQLCAGGISGQDSCDGDAGGPLMATDSHNTFYLVGIVSFGSLRCGSEGIPSVNTRVTSYLSWILDNMRP